MLYFSIKGVYFNERFHLLVARSTHKAAVFLQALNVYISTAMHANSKYTLTSVTADKLTVVFQL